MEKIIYASTNAMDIIKKVKSVKLKSKINNVTDSKINEINQYIKH